MPHTILSNAAHTLIRRSTVKELGAWNNNWSRRVPGTTWWEVELSHECIDDLLSWSRFGESLSDTIIRLYTTRDRLRRAASQPTQEAP